MKTSHRGGVRDRSLRATVHFGTILLATFVTGFVARFLLESRLSWRCPSIILFGWPCPSCGTTRALAALAQFDLLSALRFNPLVIVTLGVAVLAPFLELSWTSFERGRGWLLLGVAAGFNWVYLLFFLPR
jgi:hypothetical protein